VWLGYLSVGLVIVCARLIVQAQSWLLVLISVSAAIVISLGLCYLGLWGGADGKGFICLAIATPLSPLVGWNLLPSVNPFFPLVVFSNAYLAAIVSVVYPIQRNVRMRSSNRLFQGFEAEPLRRKAAALLIGYRVPISEFESKDYLFPLESFDRSANPPTRRLSFQLRIDADRDKYLAETRAALASGELRDTIWVSPGLPFLVFVTAGLILTLLFGDIVFAAVSGLMQVLLTAH
jgi:preflagellin peptidase FlaK